jgi:ABC-2 type transport system permease protein
MTQEWLLGQRALREGWRTPEALLPTLFIPLFFLVVNVGQAAKIFPSASTEFLHGQGYGAFQLPSSLLLAASFGTAALFLVEDIEGGYFDKLRAAPVSRTAIVLGHLRDGGASLPPPRGSRMGHHPARLPGRGRAGRAHARTQRADDPQLRLIPPARI